LILTGLAELEARLNLLSSADQEIHSIPSVTTSNSVPTPEQVQRAEISWVPDARDPQTFNLANLIKPTTMSYSGPEPSWNGMLNAAPQQHAQIEDWDINNMFLLPASWPKNLPAPCKSMSDRTDESPPRTPRRYILQLRA
jgi:hypothetical protein